MNITRKLNRLKIKDFQIIGRTKYGCQIKFSNLTYFDLTNSRLFYNKSQQSDNINFNEPFCGVLKFLDINSS